MKLLSARTDGCRVSIVSIHDVTSRCFQSCFVAPREGLAWFSPGDFFESFPIWVMVELTYQQVAMRRVHPQPPVFLAMNVLGALKGELTVKEYK